jgi:hypothetical protein
MNGLAGADTGKVAVTLIGEHKAVRPAALDASGNGGSTSVGSLLPIDVYIIIGKHGTTHRAYTDSLLLEAHLFDDFGHELVYHAMGATRAVVHVGIVEERRFLIDDVLR